KVKPGDRVLSIDGAALARSNIFQAEYLLNTLSPRQTTHLRLRDPEGAERDVAVDTKVVPGRQLRNLTGAGASEELNDMIRQEEADERQYRQQYVEIGDVMI